MKKIPLIKFSLCLLLAVYSHAQTSKTYTESFNVNKDAQVSLKANNAEIIIETWNKNRVDVEATITVEVEDEKLANKILENYKFEALGNSSKVEIRAGQDMRRIFRGKNSFMADDAVVEILTEDIRGLRAPLPPRPPLPPNVDFDIQFDMERFNDEGKAYILKFQKEVQEKMNDSNFKKGMRKWKKDFVKGYKKDSDSIKVFTYQLKNDLKPRIKFLRNHLDLENKKINKKIIIKMPKDAKLNLDVKRSELKIADLNQIDANLNYSSLHIDELTGNDCKISANHTRLDIAKAKNLNLDLKYAKDVNIGEVLEFVSISKTSNLVIDNLGQKAIIEGTFGELNIKNIDEKFTLIDINLKNSTAKLNIPHDKINFYINSKSSNFNQNTDVDFKMSTISDAVIYQNSKPTSTAQNINIKADFSTLTLM